MNSDAKNNYLQYYKCSAKCRKQGHTHTTYYNAVSLDSIVWQKITQILTGRSCSKYLQKYLDEQSTQDNDLNPKIESLEKEGKKLNLEYDRALLCFRKGLIEEKELERQILEIRLEQEELKNGLQELGRAQDFQMKIAKNNKKQMLETLKKKLLSLQPESRYRVCEILVKGVILNHDGNVELSLNLPNPQ